LLFTENAANSSLLVLIPAMSGSEIGEPINQSRSGHNPFVAPGAAGAGDLSPIAADIRNRKGTSNFMISCRFSASQNLNLARR
jgi:hypothetical protein